METLVFVDSKSLYSGTANNYVFRFDTPLKGVFCAELLTATFSRTSNLQHIALDIDELKTDRLVANSTLSRSFAIIPVSATAFGSNVVYTVSSFFPIKYTYTPRDIDRLTVKWEDQNGVVLPSNDNSFIIKFTHLK